MILATNTGSFFFNWPSAQHLILYSGAYSWQCELPDFPRSDIRPILVLDSEQQSRNLLLGKQFNIEESPPAQSITSMVDRDVFNADALIKPSEHRRLSLGHRNQNYTGYNKDGFMRSHSTIASFALYSIQDGSLDSISHSLLRMESRENEHNRLLSDAACILCRSGWLNMKSKFTTPPRSLKKLIKNESNNRHNVKSIENKKMIQTTTTTKQDLLCGKRVQSINRLLPIGVALSIFLFFFAKHFFFTF